MLDENTGSEALQAFASPEETVAPTDTAKARWYIVHTYSGFEKRVEASILKLMQDGEDKGCIKRVIVPTEKVCEPGKNGENRTVTRKFYPGYIMIEMVLTDFSWHLIQSVPKVTGFVGGKTRPAPMSAKEAESILKLMEERNEQPRLKYSFEPKEEVRVIDGPFMGFNGVVEEVNYEKSKLKVFVSIFDRQTPVELDFVQVSKN